VKRNKSSATANCRTRSISAAIKHHTVSASAVGHGAQVAPRAVVMQQKTKRPVQFEITDLTRQSIHGWIDEAHLRHEALLFPSRVHASPHLSTREYARIIHRWVAEIGLDGAAYGIGAPRTSGPCSCCSGIPNWKVPSAT